MSADGFTTTDRGFKHYDPIDTSYGHKLRVYESSRATEPCLWLGIDADAILNEDPQAIHLTFAEAKALRRTLKRAMKEHYQRA